MKMKIKIIEVNEEPDLSQYINFLLEEFLKHTREAVDKPNTNTEE